VLGDQESAAARRAQRPVERAILADVVTSVRVAAAQSRCVAMKTLANDALS
jgi:hypothetical protein